MTDSLVLASSLGTSGQMWWPQTAALGERIDVITYAMRGHDGDPAPRGPYTIADLAADVLALLDTRGIERAHFCGLSIGGMIGQWLGAHSPDRVDRLVLCCTSAHVAPQEAWLQRAETVRRAGSTAPIADAVVGRWLTPSYAHEHPGERDRLRAMLLACDAEAYASCCQAIGAMDLRGDLGRIAAPTLVIGAAEDPSLPVDPHTNVVAAGIPGARREIVAGSHLATVESAAAVNDLIFDHLEAA